MLEGLAAWVLNTYVGEYVENLNTAQLSIALLQGAVELENLPLKKDALKSLDIPIEVKSGFIGKITLQIPLRRLRSEPWVISIEKLYLVAGPLTNLQYNEGKEKQTEQEQKQAMLDALEAKWKIFQGVQPDASSTSSWFSYGASMATNILENIQLKVKDVHLRYEDDKMNPACPFACGAIIKNLSVQSTNSTWTPTFVSHQETDKMFKLVDLTDFGAYCDANVTMMGDLSHSDLSDAFARDMFLSKSGQFQDHEYILRPITAQGKVTRNTSALPLRSASTPRISLELTLSDMSVMLATDQYQSLNLWQREFSRHGRRRKFRQGRPACSVLSSPKDWWQFAQRSFLNSIHERNERLTKKFLTQRAHTVVCYAKIYSEYLKGVTLTPAQKVSKQEIEKDLSFQELKVIREGAFMKLKRENQLASVETETRKSPKLEEQVAATSLPAASGVRQVPPPPSAPKLQPDPANSTLFQRWFPGWSGWSSQPATTSPATSSSETLSNSVDADEDNSSTLSLVETPSSSVPSLSSSASDLSSNTVLVIPSDEELVTEGEIEQEIQDVINDSSENSSFLRKDLVFARMTFLLKKGSFKLKESILKDKDTYQPIPLVELQCSTIGMEFESRPRSSAMKFSLAVGSLFMQDQTAKNSVFNYIICPQAKDAQCRSAFNPVSHLTSVHSSPNLLAKETEGMEFFKLAYEKRPAGHFKYSLSIKTQPLDIIYTPEVIRRVKNMFNTPQAAVIRAADTVTSWQFERLKKQTQEDIKNTLDQLLEGKTSRWNINLDICAPKFIIPENTLDVNPQLVVLDLGNFLFKTMQSATERAEKQKEKDEDEDKFETPLSTPPNESIDKEEVKHEQQKSHKDSDSILSANSDNVVQDMLYEKYHIGLTEMQVLLGRLQDNWRHAYSRGTSLMHIVDRFSISVQLDRRLIVTSDAQWPTAKLSGNLPSLTFHLNERKIQGMQTCLDNFLEPTSTRVSHSAGLQSAASFDSSYGNSSPELADTELSSHLLESPKSFNEDNKLVALQFLINKLSLEVQSQDQALIELQVTGVQADVQTKPLNTSVILTVHSLLLVDAFQTYGRDFDLLVASHKNIILDSRSGSIRGSEVNSPMSPMSPMSPASPGSPTPDLTPSISFTSFQSIQDALSKAFHSVMPQGPMSPQSQHLGDSLDSSGGLGQLKKDSRALIQLEYEVITTPSNGDGNINMRVLNLNFNSLDFIANQETLVEILGFLKRTFPTKSGSGSSARPASNSSTDPSKLSKNKELIHVNADFKRLNVMMVRFLATDGQKTARKVATATMSSAKLQAEFDETWEVEGSLGGLHLLDVTPEGTLYQQVISIGQFQAVDMGPLFSAPPSPSPDMYKTAMDERIFSESFANPAALTKKNACTFVIRKQQRSVDKTNLDGSITNLHKFDRRRNNSGREETKRFVSEDQVEESESFEAQFDMASLSYIHCPKFLDELVDCVSEVQDYMTGMASSIRTAATEVAMGMVGVRESDIGTTSSAENPEDVSWMADGFMMRRDSSLENITSSVLLEETNFSVSFKKSGSAPVQHHGVSRPGPSALKVGIIFNARMESPILVIPRKPNSSEVLIAHLGEIVVDNKGMQEKFHGSGCSQLMSQNQNLIRLSLTNMNLYSLHLDQNVGLNSGEVHKTAGALGSDNSIPITSDAAGLLTSTKLSELTQSFGVPILYDTSVDLKIGKKSADIPFINPHHSSGLSRFGPGLYSPPKRDAMNDFSGTRPESGFEHISSVLDVHARISSPIKLSLSKEIYEQILQTVDHLTYDAEESKLHHKASSQRATSPFTPTSEGSTQPASESSAHSKNSDAQAEFQHPKVENGGSSFRSASAVPGSVSATEPGFLAKHVDFEVPLFEVELRGNFGEGEQGLVDLKLYDFAVQYEKNDRATTHISLRLKSLQMDDLLESPDSKHRQIIISKPSPKGKDVHLQRMFSQPKAMMSKSCPDSTIISPVPRMPSSLPSSFIEGIPSHHRLHQHQHLSRPQQQYKQDDDGTSSTHHNQAESPGLYPTTPPPSPVARDLEITQTRAADDLVHIDVTLVDKKRPEYVTKYNMTNRFINIDFACLEATINLQTWVVLLDFLGMGAKVHDPSVTDPQSKIHITDTTNVLKKEETENINSEIKFHVESFTLVFNKPEYELAQATAASLSTTINLRNGNLSASGQLGSLSLLDQSPHGHLYRQRFVSTGRQVVEFHFFKYGLPDFALQRAYDISLKLRMSSVRYIHTNRFQSELLAFAQHFLQLQDVLGRMRAASAGKKVNEQATRGARILLDIEAASPILLIPHSSETHAVLVADLGNLRLRNQFIVDGESGTLRAQTKSDTAKSSRTQSKSRSSAEPSVFHRGMTESQLNASFPPMRPVDPMAQSVYGSIEHDLRLEGFQSMGLDPPFSGQTRSHSMHRHSSDSLLMSRTHQTNKHGDRYDSLSEADELAEHGGRKLNGEDEDYRCLLDVISVTLSDMDLFTARRVWKSDYMKGDLSADMEFSTFVIEREHGPLLKEKCLLELHIEHNLEGDLSHAAPDFCINGKLSSVVCRLDGDQYQLIRGLLNHNLGEKLEEFQRPPLSHLQNPKIQTVLSGKPWKVISLTIDLRNVTVELLHSQPEESGTPEQSLGRLDFIRSQLSFTSFSNQLREVDLVSNQIRIDDTRFKNEPVNSRPNVFSSILQPSPGAKEGSSMGLQMEMHLRSAPDSTQFTILLNNMRLMCIFDWLMAMREFISKELPDPFLKTTADIHSSNPVSPRASGDQPAQRKSPNSQSPLTVSRGIVTRRGPMLEEVKVPFELVLNFADTQFVVVEDSTSLDTNAVILKNTAVILYKPQAQDKVLSCSLQSLELFSCCLMAEEDTALSIVDPTSVHVELNANPLPQPNPSASGLLGLKDAQRRQLVLEMSLKVLNMRVSYHDMVMFLAIVNSLPLQARQAQQTQHQTFAPSSERTKDLASTGTSTSAAWSVGSGKKQVTRGTFGGSASSETARVQDNMTKSMMGGLSIPCVNRGSDKEEEVVQLLELGFPEDDIRHALSLSKWHVDEAAVWLTQHSKAANGRGGAEDNSFMLTALEMNADSIMLCLIDDCGDADIPLAEIACNALSIKQEIEPCIEGKASFTLMAEYYNRKLSGWEPFLEPWKCFSEWKQYLKPERKLAVQVAAFDTLNLNVTSTLIDLYKQTSGSWTQDYQSQQTDENKQATPDSEPASPMTGDGISEGPLKSFSSSVSTPSSAAKASQSLNKRSPFIPYVIRNDTGSNLWFLTATTTPSNLSGEARTSQTVEHAYIQASDWKRVSPGERRPFHFHRREKIRHQKSHAMHVNQLVVTVEGWQRLSPVSVDKVGIYFRHTDPQAKAPPHVSPARVVFEVLQEGSARKLIIVRSALVLDNRLDSPIELKLEATDETGHYQCMTVPVNTALPVPLSCINMRMRARPCDWPVHFCNKPLDWQHVKKSGDKPDGIRTCQVIGPDKGIYRFFVCVTRQKFPEEGSSGGANSVGGTSSAKSSSSHLSHGMFLPTLPGHILTLLPPVTICNLLPLELHYYLRGLSTSGNLKAGREASLHGVDVSSKFDLGINLENFPTCKELTIPPNTHNRKVLLRIFDNNNRMLKLVVRISMVKGGSMKLTISAQFWLVNKSGLPLVFKQNGCKQLAAGQFEEHEQARSVTPLLFSFSEAEELNLCQMRVGQSVHGQHSLPHWCSPFSPEGGTSKRALHVLQQQGNRPDWVYNIGIQVTPGRGRYRGTNIVTFAPQFVLDNQSGCKLAIAQHFVTKKEIRQQEYLTALPLCSLPFHWPRVDLDQLLSVKILDIDHCRWSGGFYIDRINSFHINMRDPCGICHLLKVEVVQQGPTFFIVFADADVMPPPFRIDNCTDVPVLYYQDQTGDDRLKTFIEPQKSIPYSWDEPTVTPLRLTLGIMGGTSASYSLDKLEEGEQLHYENFIYLAATATFDRSWNGPTPELVLDCVHNNNIMFKRKEKSKRNQLWRMTGSGMLEHEGSMPPRDPRNPSTTSEPGLVLDIADLAPRPGQCVPLTLKKPDVRRKSTQTWRFTEQGQLCCHAGMMCVQAVGGDRGLQEGAIAVLGPGPSSDQLQQSIHADKPINKAATPLTTSDSWPSGFGNSGAVSRNAPGGNTDTAINSFWVPRHMLISRQKLRPGSGCISVRVSMDGPIRVIELVDIQQRQVVKRMTMEKDLEDWEVYDELKGKKKGNFRIPTSGFITELSITLKNGIGVSLVNSLSEELLYLTLKNISVDVVAKPTAITFDASVAHIQADNQMGGAQRSVVLFVSPTSRRDVLDNTPALYISAHKVPSGRWKAEIFKHLYVSTKRMTVHIEEQLLWKLLQLTGMGKDDRTLNRLDETFDTHRALSAVTSIQSTRYYFGTVKLSVNRVTLSMVTSSKLTPDLKAIKNVMPMRLIAFEQANIDMRSFEQYHVFETGPFLISEITNHYGGELRGQAAKILGSIDFLGNPLGLVHDITEGIAGFVKDGNVGGLLKNVTHGVSNSTAKVMSSISDGISTVGLDEDHNLKREELRNVTSGSSSDHIMAGFRGLSHGLVGGVTSLFSQSISGAQQEGLGGFIKGMGKGVIGTVTKPVSGVLDLTSGVANALRDSSTRTSNRDPGRLRLPRCTQGPGGLLPPYSQAAAESLTVLHELNDNNFSEHLIAMEQLMMDPSGDGNMHVLVTNRQVFFLNAQRARADNIVLKINHSEILHCSSITTDGKFYVELTRKTSQSPDASSTSLNKPRVRCDRLNIAKKVAQQIKYAKNLFEERYQTLDVDDSSDDEDW